MTNDNILEQALEHFNRGLELLDEDAYQDASAEFLLAVRANASKPYVMAERMIATAYRGMIESDNELERAVDQYKRVTSLDPNDAGSWLWLALLMDSAALDFQLAGFQVQKARGRQQIDLALKGRRGRKYEKEARKAFAKAEQTFPLFSQENSEPLTISLALEAAYATGEYFTSIEKSESVRKGIHWFSQCLDLANSMAGSPGQYLRESIDFPSLVEGAQREQILAEEKLAQLQKQDSKARRFKIIQWAIIGVVLLILLACMGASIMMFTS
jgi:tetratricopeptide (TPR) repeat protein